MSSVLSQTLPCSTRCPATLTSGPWKIISECFLFLDFLATHAPGIALWFSTSPPPIPPCFPSKLALWGLALPNYAYLYLLLSSPPSDGGRIHNTQTRPWPLVASARGRAENIRGEREKACEPPRVRRIYTFQIFVRRVVCIVFVVFR